MPKQIDEIILGVIDRGFGALGENPKHALWYCLERDFNLSRQKVPENIKAFEKALQSFFGLGYNILDSLFLNYLCEAAGENLKEYQSFAEAVNHLRSKVSSGL
jgi:hypothetical protein